MAGFHLLIGLGVLVLLSLSTENELVSQINFVIKSYGFLFCLVVLYDILLSLLSSVNAFSTESSVDDVNLSSFV